MELVRIIEKDDKTARDKVKKIYGNDCLIVSSSRIKNKSELVIAIDLDNQVDNIFLQKNKKQSPFDLNKLTKQILRIIMIKNMLTLMNYLKNKKLIN